MTRTKPTDPADTRRVLEALGAARLPSQVDPETLASAVALDDALASVKAPAVLPPTWAILAQRRAAEAAEAAEATPGPVCVHADGSEHPLTLDAEGMATSCVFAADPDQGGQA